LDLIGLANFSQKPSSVDPALMSVKNILIIVSNA